MWLWCQQNINMKEKQKLSHLMPNSSCHLSGQRTQNFISEGWCFGEVRVGVDEK